MPHAAKKPLDTYGKAYFDKWYRHPRHRVSTSSSVARKAHLAVSVAEYYLGRPIRNVLDVGCGEGQWRGYLKRIRPRIRYMGIDPSPYVLRRFGVRRNIVEGSFANLPKLTGTFDLLVCSDTLYYVPNDEWIVGLEILVHHLAGIAFLEAYPTDDLLTGDTAGMFFRSAAFYKKVFRHAGLVACGSHCYAAPALHHRVTELERGLI